MDDVQLQMFAESLSPPSAYLDVAKVTIQEVFKVLQKNSRHSLDRVRVVGGIEKKTSTAIKADIDAVIFYNNNNNVKKEDIIDDFQNILLLNTDLSEKEIHITKNNTMKFTMKGVPIDLLVGVNMVSNPSDVVNEQSRKTLAHIKHSVDPQKTSQISSAELSESSLRFMKNKSKFVHDVARLAKFWSQNILFKTYVYGRSLIMELLAVDAAMEEENNEGSSISRAFIGFLNRVCHMKKQVIFFQDFYKTSDIPKMVRQQRPLLMDPSNPYNNLLHDVNSKDGQKFINMFEFCSGVTLKVLAIGYRGCKDISLVFFPQPMLYELQMKEKWIKPKYETYLLGIHGDWLPNIMMPDYIIRNPDGYTLKDDITIMLYTLAGFVYTTTSLNPSMSRRQIMDDVEKFVNKMSGEKGKWVSCPDLHNTKAVTLAIPLNDPERRFVLLSFDFFVVGN